MGVAVCPPRGPWRGQQAGLGSVGSAALGSQRARVGGKCPRCAASSACDVLLTVGAVWATAHTGMWHLGQNLQRVQTQEKYVHLTRGGLKETGPLNLSRHTGIPLEGSEWRA